MREKEEKITAGQVLVILLVAAALLLSLWLVVDAQRENLGEELDRANEYAARLAATVLYYGSSDVAGTDFVRYFDAENCELLEGRPLTVYGEGTEGGKLSEDRRDKFIRVAVDDGVLSLLWVDLTDEELLAEPELRGYREN